MLTLGSQETSRPPGKNGPSSGKASPKQEGGGIDHFSSLRGIWSGARGSVRSARANGPGHESGTYGMGSPRNPGSACLTMRIMISKTMLDRLPFPAQPAAI